MTSCRQGPGSGHWGSGSSHWGTQIWPPKQGRIVVDPPDGTTGGGGTAGRPWFADGRSGLREAGSDRQPPNVVGEEGGGVEEKEERRSDEGGKGGVDGPLFSGPPLAAGAARRRAATAAGGGRGGWNLSSGDGVPPSRLRAGRSGEEIHIINFIARFKTLGFQNYTPKCSNFILAHFNFVLTCYELWTPQIELCNSKLHTSSCETLYYHI
jgi:hypothetical protein